ncbi:MAG: inorganic phosphate transporter [Anaerolineae bacterium]|nr:inorganic phosphate transporter [Anaerolineae bacterium]
MAHLIVLLPVFVLVSVQNVLVGVLGAPGIVATMIASHALGPRRALLLSTVGQFLGPFLFGVAVAGVVGNEVVNAQALTPLALYAALSATIIWMAATWYLGIPSSSTHALIGGMVGAAFAAAGPSAVHGDGLFKVVASLIMTAPLGLVIGFIMVRVCYWLFKDATPRINRLFNHGQWIAGLGLGLAIGSNNAQNAMGIMALGLVLTGVLPRFEVPNWVVVVSAIGLAAGNLIGGMRLIRSVGGRFFQVRPIHGFSAEIASGMIIGVSSLVGGDVSTTHVTSLAIVGAGAAERMSMVRWGFVQHVILTWVLTIPLTAALAGLTYLMLHLIGIR